MATILSRDRRRAWSGLAVAAISAVIALPGCGGGETSDPGAGAADPGAVHVHGLGVNPGDRALFVATHAGLFRAARDAAEAMRVGESRQDTMGFTLVGENHFLGSGHPGPQQQAPPVLGLIESRDAGESWRPLSLVGEADFHILEAQGRAVYGYDATSGRFLASRDGGRDWSERSAPAPVAALAIDPEDDQTLVASGPDSLYVSHNGGRRWRDLAGASGHLAWPARRHLYRAALDGVILRSDDRGRTWRDVGTIGGEPAAFEAASPRELYVALHDGTIRASVDAARTWRTRLRLGRP